jgi:CRP/FNR family transcriptional regulator, cyclic AMP receptor protein
MIVLLSRWFRRRAHRVRHAVTLRVPSARIRSGAHSVPVTHSHRRAARAEFMENGRRNTGPQAEERKTPAHGGAMGSTGKEPLGEEVLGEAELKAILRHAVPRAYPKNTIVVSEGDRAETLYIVASGRLKIYVSDEKGKEIVLNHAGPGEYFGEVMLDEGPRSASVMTVEPTRLLVVSKEDFASFLSASPEFALHLIRKLVRRVRALTGTVKSLALMDVYGRVARMLLELAVDRDGRRVITNRPTQQEMASRVGCSREMISRILTDLAEGGYVEVDRETITIARALPRAW